MAEPVLAQVTNARLGRSDPCCVFGFIRAEMLYLIDTVDRVSVELFCAKDLFRLQGQLRFQKQLKWTQVRWRVQRAE